MGDCAAYGATCVDDDLGARCASVFCPARGTARVCIDDHQVADCADGAISVGDCAPFAAWCSTAGTPAARCVSIFCVGSPAEVPVAHDVCLPDGRVAHCDDAGLPLDAAACPAGTECTAGRCLAPGADIPPVEPTAPTDAPDPTVVDPSGGLAARPGVVERDGSGFGVLAGRCSAAPSSRGGAWLVAWLVAAAVARRARRR
jgi:hypothetical protein